MTLSDLSIKNPVFAWMLMVGLIVFGAIGFTRLGKSQLPDVDFPVVTVQTSWEGASPEIMETEVTDVIEGAMTQVQGVKSITSTSRQGQAIITVEFDLDRDLDAAMQEVESRISQAQYNLPNEMDPAIISKFNPEDQPIMWLALSGDRPLREMMEYVKDVLKDQFTTIPGVGDVMLGGYVEPNLRVWLDAEKMNKRELTVEDVMGAIRNEHKEVPAGYLSSEKKEWNIRVLGEAKDLKEFQNLVIPRHYQQI
jgi:HAE1 family hydrophobic/amphiphilic exporter-1